jgi:hypothetical protein
MMKLLSNRAFLSMMNGIMSFVILAAAAGVQGSAPTHLPGGSLEFRGARLGMTLSEFKTLSKPTPGTVVVCSDDRPEQWRASFRDWLPAPGVVVCVYGLGLGPNYLQPEHLHIWERKVALSPTINVNARHFFYNDSLYRIELQASPLDVEPINEALVEKWGRATHSQAGSYDVIGLSMTTETIDGFEKVWIKPGGTVSYFFPCQGRLQLCISYSNPSIMKEVSESWALIKKERKRANKPVFLMEGTTTVRNIVVLTGAGISAESGLPHSEARPQA